MSEDQSNTATIANIDDMDIEFIKLELQDYGVVPHHKTGIDKLKEILTEVRAGTYGKVEKETTVPNIDPEVPTEPTEKAKAAAAAHRDHADISKLSKQDRALRLRRIVVVPNDPNLSEYHGLIFTVGSSSVNKGRMVKKYVPFNNEDGWHVANMIVENIQNAEMQKFRKEKMPNGEQVMRPYITKKFNVTILPDLTKQEMEQLAAAQKARGIN